MTSRTCKSCNRVFDFDESDIEPLSSVEMAICVKEGLDLERTVKIVCPFCDTPSLVQLDQPTAAAPSQTLSMAGRDFAVFTSTRDMGGYVSQNRRCGYITSFAKIPNDIVEIGRASQVNVDTEKNIMVKCVKCQSSLSSKGLATLIMAQMYSRVQATGGQMQALLEGKCPQCGNKECFCLFDPSGFEWARSAAVPTPEPKKKGLWPFKK